MKGLIVTANVTYAAQQAWGSEIAEVQQKIKAKYPYDKLHDADSVLVMMTYLALADKQRNRQEATSPEEAEKVNMVSMGMERLQQLVQKPLERYESEEKGDESVVEATSDSDSYAGRGRYRGRGHRKEKRRGSIRSKDNAVDLLRRCQSILRQNGEAGLDHAEAPVKKSAAKYNNPTNCPFCKEFL